MLLYIAVLCFICIMFDEIIKRVPSWLYWLIGTILIAALIALSFV